MDFDAQQLTRVRVQSSAALATALRQARLARGVDQATLAEAVHTYRPNISHLESGRHVAQLHLLFDVLRELDLELVLQRRDADD